MRESYEMLCVFFIFSSNHSTVQSIRAVVVHAHAHTRGHILLAAVGRYGDAEKEMSNSIMLDFQSRMVQNAVTSFAVRNHPGLANRVYA